MSYRADKLGDGRTDGRTQATTIPEGQYWPRVKRQLELTRHTHTQCCKVAWSVDPSSTGPVNIWDKNMGIIPTTDALAPT